MAKFFIDRPIFAWVVAIILMLAGALSITQLPVSQYPNVAPPSIAIQARYPGASAQTVQDTVTQVIEQQMNGLDGLRYMEATSNADGSMSLTLTFNQGTNPDVAQMQIQNKLQLATPLIPVEVQQQGITVRKATRNYLMVAAFYSEDDSMTDADIGDYVVSSLQDPISRVPGIGDIQVFGASKYSMRIWIDPDKLTSYGITVDDISSAITAQNAQVSAGEVGGTPAVPGQRLDATIIAQTRLNTTEQFANIMVRVQPDGSQVRLKDVARIEMGSESYALNARYNGHRAAGLGLKLAPGSNALQTAQAVKDKIKSLEPYFPHSLKGVFPNDTTPFVKLSIEEVIKTLLEAIVLVFLVMYLFLQNIRATIIPTIAVPVVLLGTFAVMSAFGFNINTLTMFGMVLAIGLLVDDAIVVVENVERVMHEEHLSARDATVKSMGQITGALVGIAMVLAAVFIPMAFFAGSTGVVYRQFSITIASAMGLSVLVALILTPALCATILKPTAHGHNEAKRGFFGWFNRTFDRGTNAYGKGVGGFLKRPVRSLLLYACITGAMVFLFIRIPTSFLPDEDQGFAYISVTLPSGSTMEETNDVLKKIETYLLENEKEAVSDVFTVAGAGFGGRGQNSGLGFVKLRDWSERTESRLKLQAVLGRTMASVGTMKKARVYVVPPPAIAELGTANGFDFRLIDRAGLGHEKLMAARNQLFAAAQQSSALTAVRPTGLEDTPQYYVNVDAEKASALGLSIPVINRTLSTAMGSAYINDFIDRGRVKRVYVQGELNSRMLPEDIEKWQVRNNRGEMVPFSAFSKGSWVYGSPALERFNGDPSIAIQGNATPGESSGSAMKEMERLASQLPQGIGSSWSGMSFEEAQAGSQAPMLYAISLLVIFLCLAALYESWSIPFAVMLVVPLGVIGAVTAVTLRGLTNDVYFQVGLLTTVGLSAKNAILIVEFAKEAHEKGMSLVDATIHAARQRLRPILMTSLAFGFGVFPLVIASSAGSGSQNAIGTSVLGGVITATLLAVFLVPVFFVVVTKLFKADRKHSAHPPIGAIQDKTGLDMQAQLDSQSDNNTHH